MNVRFVSGPRSGETAHLQPHVAEGLVAAGLAVAISPRESLPQPGAPAAEPEFDVCTIGGEKKYLAIRLKILNGTYFWHGDPAKVHDRNNYKNEPFNSTFGRAVPPAISQEYAALYKKNPAMRYPLPDPKLRDKSNDSMRDKMAEANRQSRMAAKAEPQAVLIRDDEKQPTIIRESQELVTYEQSDYSKRS